MIIHLSRIQVSERLRTDPGDDDHFGEFCESIKRSGLLQAVIVSRLPDGQYELVAGERRLRAIKHLNAEGIKIPDLEAGQFMEPGFIRAEVMGELTPETDLMLEFEENERRKDFSFQEKAKYVKRMHEMLSARYPNRWTQEMTAGALNLSAGSISYYLNLQQAISKNPEVAKAATMQAAIKRMKRVQQLDVRRIEAQKDEGGKLTRAKEMLYNADAREWLTILPDSSVDLVNLDPPWGDEVSRKAAENWEEFDDSTEYSSLLIPTLLSESFRILKSNRHCIFWYRQWAYAEMRDLALAAGFDLRFSRTPCIWYKPDKLSDQNRFPEKQLIDAYETFFILRKGDPVFYDKEIQNVFVEPRVSRAEQLHPTQKPAGLMERLVKLCSVPDELVIDPCAGSGATLIAAYNVKRKAMGCELMPTYYERGLTWLAEILQA